MAGVQQMSDLIDKLNDQSITGFNAVMEIREQAAKEIERLEDELAVITMESNVWKGGRNQWAAFANKIYKRYKKLKLQQQSEGF